MEAFPCIQKQEENVDNAIYDGIDYVHFVS